MRYVHVEDSGIPDVLIHHVQLDPLLLLAFLPKFEKYQDDLKSKTARTASESHVLTTVGVLIDYLRKDYAATLAKVANLTEHGEITFDTLFAVFVPGTRLIADCPVTGEPRAFELVSATKVQSIAGGGVYDLICESVDAARDTDPEGDGGAGLGAAAFNPAAPRFDPHVFMPPPPMPGQIGVDAAMQRASGKTFGRVQSRIFIKHFKGTTKINSLDAYPIEYHANPGTLELALIERGKKWLSLRGIHHMQYTGAATYTVNMSGDKKGIKFNVRLLRERIPGHSAD